jgi:6-phosphogluconolactonase
VTDDISEGVLAFSIDSTTGAVTEVAGSPFAVPAGGAGLDIVGVASDPSGKFLYTANDQGKGLSGFVIDSSSGGLTNVPGSPYITANTQATQTCCVATHPSGKFVYALNQNGATVSAFTMDATSGTLTAVAGSPFAFPIQSDGSPSSAIGPILIEPSGKFMYVGLGDLNLAVFAIDGSTGALKQAKEALVPLPFAAQAMAITTKQQ